MGSDSEAEKSAHKEKEKKKLLALAPIAKPLAGKKLCKRTLKPVRRAAENKCLKRGVKEVVKSIRRGNKGLCVIAGNISPIDVISHVLILCEDADIPYIYVPTKELSHKSYFPTELVKIASEFQAKVDKMKARRMEEIENGRAKRMHISNGEILEATRHMGLFDAKLEGLEELLDDMKTV